MIGSMLKKARFAVIAGAMAVATMLGAATDADAQARRLNSMSGWTVLGVRAVADRVDFDTIRLGRSGRWSQIKLCVVGRAMRMRDLEVVFGNGRTQDVRVRRRFRANTCTRAIDLRGRGARRIRRIEMAYDALRDRGRQPIVIVVGRR